MAALLTLMTAETYDLILSWDYHWKQSWKLSSQGLGGPQPTSHTGHIRARFILKSVYDIYNHAHTEARTRRGTDRCAHPKLPEMMVEVIATFERTKQADNPTNYRLWWWEITTGANKMGTLTSHYCRGYYCTNIHPWIAVVQFRIETFSPGNEEKKKETTHKYISSAWAKGKRYGSGTAEISSRSPSNQPS